MSLNWVMLSPSNNPPFAPLPSEQTLYTSPPRIALNVSSPSHYPAVQQQPFNQSHASGRIYLTNHRIIYLPDRPTEKLKSFAAPLLNLHDSHVTAPFFGPNAWIALLQPVQGGGIPTPSGGVVELKLTFKDGGAFDFHSAYERVRERLQQAVANSQMNGDGTSSSRGGMNGVNVTNVNLEDLPAYTEESDGPLLSPVAAATAASQCSSPVAQAPRDSVLGVRDETSQTSQTSGTRNTFEPPAEPPPAYEEAQRAGVDSEVSRRLTENHQ